MVRARTLAERLHLSEIDADRGAFYLGSTAPDIRVITRADRADTHFFDLDNLDQQDPVETMLAEHPLLRKPSGLEVATASFIAGYITHLVLDEAWIAEVYRPAFGIYSDIDNDPRSNVLDRVLQYELDRQDRIDNQSRQDLQRALEASAPPGDIPFIDKTFLTRWFQMMIDIVQEHPGYGGFRRMMSRHLAGAGFSETDIDACCRDPLPLVEEAISVVSPERIVRFWEHATDLMDTRVRQYLR